MKLKLPLLLLLILTEQYVYAQINFVDSTAQAITYWNIGDQVKYNVSYEKYRVNHGDTTRRSVVDYDVNVSVLDSTAQGYTIEWLYHNFITSDTNYLIQKLIKANNSIRIVYKTDEFGVFLGVSNVDEIKEFNAKSLELLKNELAPLKLTGLDGIIANMAKMYNTKTSIETNSIKDVLQYHNFYGAKYRLGEVYEGESEVPNLMSDIPFSASIITTLEEIDPEYVTYRLFSSQTVDGDQLETAIKGYLHDVLAMTPESIAKTSFEGIKNQINTVGIYDEYGWLLSGYQKVEVSLSGELNIEERFIYIE